MARRLLIVLGVLAGFLAAGCVPTAPVQQQPGAESPAPPHAGAQAWMTEMLELVNGERARLGSAPLSHCGTLDAAAQSHSADQAAHEKMSHTGSNGSDPGQRILAAGYRDYSTWAENVAAGYGSVGAVMQGWMGSSGHSGNILDPEFRHVGLGLANSGGGTAYWTQVFGAGGTC